MNFTPENGSTLQVVVVGENRIGTVRPTGRLVVRTATAPGDIIVRKGRGGSVLICPDSAGSSVRRSSAGLHLPNVVRWSCVVRVYLVEV